MAIADHQQHCRNNLSPPQAAGSTFAFTRKGTGTKKRLNMRRASTTKEHRFAREVNDEPYE
jgi:hypothetical protein